MDLRSVECVLKIAETGHFGRAATELHVSQPALSHRINTLEREIGVKLFDRDRRGVRITEAGRAFLEPARAAVNFGRHAADTARRAADGQLGTLRLGFTVIASYTALPTAVQTFRALFDALVGCFRAAGVEPNVVQEATPVTTLAGLVAAGAGIGFVTRGVAVAGRPGVTFREVDGAPAVPIGAAWAGELTVTAQNFLDILATSD